MSELWGEDLALTRAGDAFRCVCIW